MELYSNNGSLVKDHIFMHQVMNTTDNLEVLILLNFSIHC